MTMGSAMTKLSFFRTRKATMAQAQWAIRPHGLFVNCSDHDISEAAAGSLGLGTFGADARSAA